ncbi:MAG: DUF393 domain-containing protein [bacterium]|nr:DUF393 domain-containing protein [bacterium]
MKPTKKLTIYFDGSCHLCSREIEGYRKQDVSEKLKLIDISTSNFDASADGLDPQEVKRVMHVRRPDGRVVTGIDAFVAIWRHMGIFTILSFLVEHQPSRAFFLAGYRIFAMIRPLLPKKNCDNYTCYKK